MQSEPILPDPLSPIEHHHILRDQIQHEDNLTTQRLSWLMASEAFFLPSKARTERASPALPRLCWSRRCLSVSGFS
jgi:hypothetical protein